MLEHPRITQVVLTHSVHGNGSICSGKCLHLRKADSEGAETDSVEGIDESTDSGIQSGTPPPGTGIVSTIGSRLARYATKAMLATTAKTALRGSLNAAKRAVPYLIAHKVVSTIANAAKKRKRVDIDVKHSQELQSKKAFVDKGIY